VNFAEEMAIQLTTSIPQQGEAQNVHARRGGAAQKSVFDLQMVEDRSLGCSEGSPLAHLYGSGLHTL
jgi:hypothetical protein